VGFGDGQGFVDVVMRAVDVLEHTFLQAPRSGVVFLLLYIMVRAVQEIAGLVQMAAPGQVSVNGFVLVEVLAVVDGSFLDFTDGVVDFVNCGLFFGVESSAVGPMLEVGPSIAQVAEGVDVSRMLALRTNTLRREREQEGEHRHEHCKFGENFHS
jgi:hypothetical protein